MDSLQKDIRGLRSSNNLATYRWIIVLLMFVLLESCNNADYMSLPKLSFLKIDSVTKLETDDLNEKRDFIILIFSPDCEHCQQQTEKILNHEKQLRKTNIYFVTYDPLDRLRVFDSYYKLYNYPNIHLLWDKNFQTITKLKPTTLPYILICTKSLKIKTVIKGAYPIDSLLAKLNS